MDEHEFSKGQEVVIVKRDDALYGYRAKVVGYSYYPETIVYELEIVIGYQRWLWRKIPIIRHRGMVGEWLRVRSI